MKTTTTRPTNFKEFYHALLAAARSLKQVSRWQKQLFMTLVLVLTWIVSGRYAYKLMEPRLLIAEEAMHPVAEEAAATPEPTRDSYIVSTFAAEEVARVLYGMRDNDAEELSAVVWCIINRVESTLYPNTLVEVCEQPHQWMGYSVDNPVLDDLYDIAYDVLYAWETDGHRPFGQEYLWFSWAPDQITFRTSFEEGRGCKYWRAG